MGTRLDDLPELSYINNMTLEDVTNLFMDEYKKNLKEITGEEPVIDRSDPYRLLILSQSVMNMQMLLYIDHAGKMNSLKYAHDAFLDHMGSIKNRPRKEAQRATVEVLFTMEAARQSAEPIPAGTMVTADQSIFFETMEYAEIPAGETETTVTCICTVTGTIGNNYAPGEISTLVTPIGFITAVRNTAKSAGGSDRESDEEYREGIYNAPNKYSAAGPDDAWVAIVKDFNADIEDVRPTTVPGSGINTILVLMKHGRLPEESEMKEIREHLLRPDIRPFGIGVEVKAPAKAEYSVELTFYIGDSGKERVLEICAGVEAAVARYTEWQGARIGRDVNPDELLAMVKNAGAKRAVIKTPLFRSVEEGSVPFLVGEPKVTFGGVESD